MAESLSGADLDATLRAEVESLCPEKLKEQPDGPCITVRACPSANVCQTLGISRSTFYRYWALGD